MGWCGGGAQIGRLTHLVANLAARALVLDELAQQPDRDELETGHHHEDTKQEQRPVSNRAGANCPENAQIGQNGEPDTAEQEGRPTEDMEGPRGVARVQHHAEEIEPALEQPSKPIFRLAELARPVIDRNFANGKPPPVKQNRNEPVQFAIEVQAVQRFSAVGLEAAIEIIQPHAGQLADDTVEELGRQGLVQRIVALVLPARDDVQAALQSSNKVRDLCRVILQVCVHRENDITGSHGKPGIEGGGLAEIATEPNKTDVLVLGTEGRQTAWRIVSGPVIHKDDLKVVREVLESVADFRMQALNALFLVQDRDDEGNQTRGLNWWRGGVVHARWPDCIACCGVYGAIWPHLD